MKTRLCCHKMICVAVVFAGTMAYRSSAHWLFDAWFPSYEFGKICDEVVWRTNSSIIRFETAYISPDVNSTNVTPFFLLSRTQKETTWGPPAVRSSYVIIGNASVATNIIGIAPPLGAITATSSVSFVGRDLVTERLDPLMYSAGCSPTSLLLVISTPTSRFVECEFYGPIPDEDVALLSQALQKLAQLGPRGTQNNQELMDLLSDDNPYKALVGIHRLLRRNTLSPEMIPQMRAFLTTNGYPVVIKEMFEQDYFYNETNQTAFYSAFTNLVSVVNPELQAPILKAADLILTNGFKHDINKYVDKAGTLHAEIQRRLNVLSP